MGLKSKIIFIVGALFVGGCVTESEIDYRLSSWNGVDVDQLIRIWGAPHGKHAMKDGTHVYTFEGSRVRSSGTFPANTESRHCQVNFVIDSNSRIQSSYWRGVMDQCGRMIIANPGVQPADPALAPSPEESKSSNEDNQKDSSDSDTGSK